MARTYVVDASALIDMHDLYPRPIFPGVWEEFGKLARSGRAVAPRQACDEVIGSKFLRDWCKANDGMFVGMDLGIWERAREIAENHPTLARPNKLGQQADPFVVAMACAMKSPPARDEPVIITHENSENGKIPSVARSLGVESDRLTGLFAREGWTF